MISSTHRRESYELGPDFAAVCDAQDPLRAFRERFYTRPGVIYLDGNSLGLASRDAEQALLVTLEDWKTRGIDGWTSGPRPWFYMAEALGRCEAELVGARPDEVVVAGTTTVNLHTLVSTFYHPIDSRTKILTDELDFPSDVYALQSQVRLQGLDPADHLVLAKSRDGRTLAEEDLIAAMTDEVALVLLSSVLYRSGQLLDMQRLTQAAHERGILIGFDLSHSAGCIPHRLHEWDVDFAFWCNYKYLNSGPGATASLFVHTRHFGKLPGLTGWFGYRKERQFDMALHFEPAPTAGAWQISTTSVFSTATIYGSLQMFVEAGIENIRQKSLRQTGYLIFLIDQLLSKAPYGFSLGTPRAEEQRGGHIALEHPDAIRICKALKARELLIPDFRYPNVIRLAPAALYTTYSELWQAAQLLQMVIDTGLHKEFDSEREIIS